MYSQENPLADHKQKEGRAERSTRSLGKTKIEGKSIHQSTPSFAPILVASRSAGSKVKSDIPNGVGALNLRTPLSGDVADEVIDLVGGNVGASPVCVGRSFVGDALDPSVGGRKL